MATKMTVEKMAKILKDLKFLVASNRAMGVILSDSDELAYASGYLAAAFNVELEE